MINQGIGTIIHRVHVGGFGVWVGIVLLHIFVGIGDAVVELLVR